MKKVLSFNDFLFEGEKIYQPAGDQYSYKVVDGVWFTKGPKIPSWKSLASNMTATNKLDKSQTQKPLFFSMGLNYIGWWAGKK